jgi:processing peptidase subunit alpha
MTPLNTGKSRQELLAMRKNETKIMPPKAQSTPVSDLSQPMFLDIPTQEIIPKLHLQDNNTVKMTKLQGITVSSVERDSIASTLVLMFPRGLRHLNVEPDIGVAQILNRLLIDSGDKYNAEFMNNNLDRMMFETALEIEDTYLSVQFPPSSLEIVMEALQELTSGNPKISPETLADAVESWKEQIEDNHANPAASQVSTDLIAQACFGTNFEKGSIGNPMLNVKEQITLEDINRVAKKLFRRDGVVLFGLGIDHEKLVDLTRKLFPPQEYSDFVPNLRTTNQKAQFIGQELKIEFLEAPQELGKQNLPQLTQMAVTFEGISWKTSEQDQYKSIFCMYILNTLIGGGDSFSSGGPGKGLYSVINRYFLGNYPFFSMNVNVQMFMDSGTFSISASAHHGYAKYLSKGIHDFVRFRLIY